LVFAIIMARLFSLHFSHFSTCITFHSVHIFFCLFRQFQKKIGAIFFAVPKKMNLMTPFCCT
jgi:hypothetical protein